MRKQELHPRTAVLNKNQKNTSKILRLSALQWLAMKFPSAFDNTSFIRPLKIRIMDDILAYADEAAKEGISRGKLREAVVIFTRRLDYLACLKAREMRVDLQGMELTEVTQEEAEQAALKIKKRVEKSARNARKQMAVKALPTSNTPNFSYTKANTYIAQEQDDFFPTYPPRSASINLADSQIPKPASVIVKHKATRQYDPSAVARLKEKLGLSRAEEDKKEMVE